MYTKKTGINLLQHKKILLIIIIPAIFLAVLARTSSSHTCLESFLLSFYDVTGDNLYMSYQNNTDPDLISSYVDKIRPYFTDQALLSFTNSRLFIYMDKLSYENKQKVTLENLQADRNSASSTVADWNYHVLVSYSLTNTSTGQTESYEHHWYIDTVSVNGQEKISYLRLAGVY